MELGEEEDHLSATEVEKLCARIVELEAALAEQQQLGPALRATCEELRCLAENSRDVLWVLTPEEPRRTLYVNTAFEDVWQRPCDALRQNPAVFEQAVHDEDRPHVRRSLTGLCQGGLTWNDEFRVVRPDGSVRTVRARGVRVGSAEPGSRHVAVVIQDVTADNLASLLDHIGDSIVATDLHGRITYVNQALAQRLKRSCRELVGTSVSIFGEDTSRGASRSQILQSTLKTGAWQGEVASTAKDGSEIVMDTRTWMLRDQTGKAFGFCGVATDITDRKRTEEAWRESEERYRGVFSASVDGIMIGTPDWHVLDANPAACELHRCSREELLGLSAYDLVHPDYADTVVEARRALDELGRFFVETVFRRRDGATVAVDVSGRHFQHNGEPHILVVIRDITERKRAEETLRASETRYRQLYEHSTDGIVSCDMDGTILRCNPAYERMVGYAIEELRSLTIWDLTPEKWHEQLSRIVREGIVPRGYSDPYEKEYRRKDGTIVPIEVNAFLIRGDQGQPAGMWGIARDASERKRSEELVRRHQSELAHASRLSLMGEMAAGLAHELNQPLGAIANYAGSCIERLQSEPSDTEKVLVDLAKITHQAERAGQVIRNIRAFLRKQQDRRLALDINDVIRDAVHLAESEAVRSGIPIELSLTPALPPVEVVAIEIEQVLVNLIRNALESMHDADPADKRLLISSGPHGDGGIVVSVRDWGSGIPPDLLGHLFDPFLTTKPGGMGMGLAISRRIVEAHGGRLWTAENHGEGTTFTFSLPPAQKDDNTPVV